MLSCVGNSKVWGLEFSPLTPNILASGGEDGALLVWDLTTPSETSMFPPLKVRDGFSFCKYIRCRLILTSVAMCRVACSVLGLSEFYG